MTDDLPTAERLPPEAEMNRDDALRAFVAVLNTVEPDHPYFDDPYPISIDGVNYGVTRSCYARCGPRSRWAQKVSYKTRMTYINEISRARHLALLTHEVTHIPYNDVDGDQHGVHAPEFWREYAFHAHHVRDGLRDGDLGEMFAPVEVDDYLHEVVQDPNSAIVDRRYETVDERKAELADLVGVA